MSFVEGLDRAVASFRPLLLLPSVFSIKTVLSSVFSNCVNETTVLPVLTLPEQISPSVVDPMMDARGKSEEIS